MVSHDREFLDGLVEKVYEFGGGRVRECLGGIYEFLEKKKLESLRELERTKPSVPDSPRESAAKPPQKINYAEQREREKMVKRAAKKVQDAENEITRLESEVADIETQLAAGNVEGDILDRYSKTKRDLDNAMSVWELASQEHDDLVTRFAR